MKCCSRSTLGVIIGILNVFIYIVFSIYSIVSLTNLNSSSKGINDINELKHHETLNDDDIAEILFSVFLVVFLIMIIISGLLIMGIVKKRHNLMLPWLIISFVGYVANAIKFLVGSVVLATEISFGSYVISILFGLLTIGIQTLVLWLIYSLYKDIRDNQAKGRVISAAEAGYTGDQPQAPKNINYVKF